MAIKKKTIEETYQKLTPLEHILKRPDTYVGAVTSSKEEIWIPKELPSDVPTAITFEKQSIEFVPAFLKVFDEILTNASDHVRRDTSLTKIRVEVTDTEITVENDGKGIPTDVHATENCPVPELIFGHLLTGSNYDDTEERFGGGRNGYGAKLTNIFSKRFEVKTGNGKKVYKGVWENSMTLKRSNVSDGNYSGTRIRFTPDLTLFHTSSASHEISDDVKKLFFKRAIEVSVANPKVKVYFNGQHIKINNLKDLAKCFASTTTGTPEIIYERINDFWEVAVIVSPTDSYEQLSIANGISTYRGGTHVNYIASQIVNELRDDLSKDHKGIKISPFDIKNKMMLFLNCTVPNPTFDTQTKENLTLAMKAELVKDVQLSPGFFKKVMKSEIVAQLLAWIEAKKLAELKKMNQGHAVKMKIDKLHDAVKAGTNESSKCSLFVCEGDSAKSMVLAGLTQVSDEYYGVFPLKGKILNVRDAAFNKIKDNVEISNILTALGLVPGHKVTSLSELRYGRIISMTDADVDGIHIKGLLINLIQHFWPELLTMGFFWEFVTPIVRATRANNPKDVKVFYKLQQYTDWKAKTDTKGWKIKYYKGLGTHTADDAKKYFANIDKQLVPYNYTDEKADELINMAFSKDKIEDRKNWVNGWQGPKELDKLNGKYTFTEFINEELVEFSWSDNNRSLPIIEDGLKPALRKILYTALDRNLTEPLKVIQFAGAIGEKTAYHHGDVSLTQTIVGMAQDFVGSNNLNLLMPDGQFGTRRCGGSDFASPRYIFTYLNPIVKKIFRAEDAAVLEHNYDDGYKIEPISFMPVIPTVLINGSEGIGTGWSTKLLNYNPLDITKWLIAHLTQGKKSKLIPWWRGFTGAVSYDKESAKWITKGKIKRINSTHIEIIELPVGMWTDKYTSTLDALIESKFIKDYQVHATEGVSIDVTFPRGVIDKLSDDKLISRLRLETGFSELNQHMFFNSKIKRYTTPIEIIEDWMPLRLVMYGKRKKYLLDELSNKVLRNDNLLRFIDAVLNEKLIINKRARDVVEKDLVKLKIEKLNDSYDYYLNQPIISLTKEKYNKLVEENKKLNSDLKTLTKTKIEDLWLADLEELKTDLQKLSY